MEYKAVLMVIATNIGNIYRNVFTIELFSWRKLAMSICFSTLLGTILVLYVQESHMPLWLALTTAVLMGMVSSNIGQLVLSIGRGSEKRIGQIGVDLIDTKLRNIVGLNKTENNSTKQENNGTDLD